MNQRMETLSENLFDLIAQHRRRGPVDDRAFPFHVDTIDSFSRGFEQQANPLLGLTHRGLGPLLGVHVGVHADPLPESPPPWPARGRHAPAYAGIPHHSDGAGARPGRGEREVTAVFQTWVVFARSSGWTALSQPHP